MSGEYTKGATKVLHEFTRQHKYLRPKYVLVMSKKEANEEEFLYAVNVANVCGIGDGSSKGMAKDNAARKALEILSSKGLYNPNLVQCKRDDLPTAELKVQVGSPLGPGINFVGILRVVCGEFQWSQPEFKQISVVGPPHKFTYECKIYSMTTQAIAPKKKQAKQLSARYMLHQLRHVDPNSVEECASGPNFLTDKHHKDCPDITEFPYTLGVMPSRAMALKDFINTLKNIVKVKNMKVEDFEEQFQKRNRDGLDFIFSALDVKYEINFLQESPPRAVALFGLETPFKIMIPGSSKENAIANLISEIYTVLDIYLNM